MILKQINYMNTNHLSNQTQCIQSTTAQTNYMPVNILHQYK